MSKEDAAPTAFPYFVKPQDQSGGPGYESKMETPAIWTQLEFWDDKGNPYLKEYEGRGLLKDKAAIITGGDSGIGRSVAILMAREGADVTIMYLPDEQEDADWTIKMIEKAGRKGHGIAGDVKDHGFLKKAVDEHLKVHNNRLNILVNNGEFGKMASITLSSCTDHV